MADSDSAAESMPMDVYHQSFTLQMADGTPFNVTLTDVDTYVSYGIRVCINYSTQIGASALLLLVLLLLTKRDKRASAVFFLNSISLVLNIIRSVLQCLYFTGGFYRAYAYFSGDYSGVSGVQYQISITGIVLTFLLLVCIEVSLIIQVRVVCITLTRAHRGAIIALSVLVALVAIGFRFALMIVNARAISAAENFTRWYWLANATNITTTISVCFFCAIFVVKLGFALVQRRRLGIKQFGPMQIILIMGCQTLFVPAFFSILQYAVFPPEMASQVLTIVALSLPLSSLWASAALDDHPKVSSLARAARRNILASGAGSGSGSAPSARTRAANKHGSTLLSSIATQPDADESRDLELELKSLSPAS